MKGADRIVLAEGVAVVAATTITSFAQGEGFPPPAVFLGGAAMFGGLVLLARPAPAFAVSLGGLVVVYGLLRATKPGGKSVGEILVEAVTGIGTGQFETPGSGRQTQPSSITPVAAAAPASAAAPTTGATGTAPAGAASPVAAPGLPDKPMASWTRLGGVAAHMSRAIGNWESDNAVDLAVPRGTPVFAVADGTITVAGWNNLGGNRVHLATSGNEFYYAHLSRIIVPQGTRVRAGQLIGYSGDTGNAQGTTPHLHFASRAGNPETLIGY